MGILDFFIDQNRQGQREQFAQQTYGQSNPALALLAKVNPDLFDKYLATDADSQASSSALAKLLGPQQESQSGQQSSLPINIMPQLTDAVKKFEGFSPLASWDYKQNSNGYGTKAAYAGEHIDPQEAERRLNSELGNAQRSVEQFVPDAPEGVKNALASLTYNTGTKWQSSGLGQAVKKGDYDTAKSILLQYNKAGGQTLPGLVERRQQEASWFPQDASSPLAAYGQVANAQSPSMNDAQPSPLAQLTAPNMGQPAAPSQAAPQAQADPLANLPIEPAKKQLLIKMLQSPNKAIRDQAKAIAEGLLTQQFDQKDPDIKTIDNPDGTKSSAQWDRVNRKWVPVKIDGQANQDAFADLTGQEYLSEVGKQNPGRASSLKAMLEGRAQLPVRGPQRQAILDQLGRIEPGFDLTKWKARNDLRAERAGGKSGIGLSLQSLGQFYQHISSAYDKIDSLNNNETVPGLNPALNKGAKFFSGDFQKRYNALGTDLDAASTEMAKILRGSGTMSEKEAADWKKRFDLDAAPSAQKAVLEEANNLVQARLHEIQNRWNTTMGEEKDITDPIFMSPEARKAFDKFTALSQEKAAPEQGATQTQGSAPAKVSSPEEFAQLPSGAEFIAPDGSHRRKP